MLNEYKIKVLKKEDFKISELAATLFFSQSQQTQWEQIRRLEKDGTFSKKKKKSFWLYFDDGFVTVIFASS